MCLAFCPRSGALWVGGQQGLVLCDRFLGQHVVSTQDVPVAFAMSEDGETGVAIGQSGRLSVVQRAKSDAIPHARTGLHRHLNVFRSQGQFFVSGVGNRGGRLLEVQQSRVRRIAILPHGAACGPGRRGPRIARVVQGVARWTKPETPGQRPSDSGHVLAIRRRKLLSWTSKSVHVHLGEDPVRMRIAGVSTCDLDPSGSRIAVGTRDGRVGVLRLQTDEHIKKPRLHRISRAPVRAVRFSPDGDHLATLSDEVDIWNMGGGEW